MTKIAVIGGGAAGLMAAITAAREGAQVCILEHKDRVGKKLLSTGNGRCNFTNLAQEPCCYHSENARFPWKIIEGFDVHRTIAFFLELGIYSQNRGGYLYPHSGQASAVSDVLRMEADRLGIEVKTGHRCLGILPGKNGFCILTEIECEQEKKKKNATATAQGRETKEILADKVILAAGSKAAPASGSDGSGYMLAEKLGHHLVPVLPSLVQLCCREHFYKSIAGVRINGCVSVYVDGEFQAKDEGELQLTGYGISGIPVFQVSRYAAIGLYDKKKVTAVINFMPDFTEGQLTTLLKSRITARPDKIMQEFFIGLFHKKLSELLLKLAHIDGSKKAGKCTASELEALRRLIQGFTVEVTGTNSFEQAQVCRGGIDTGEVNPRTLESCRVPGLYFAGEILDVDGICGGYNLQWAWSSGYTAGKEAAHA